MTLLMNLIFAQPCWQLSCLSGWEEQVFAELELGALESLIISQLAFLILWRRWQAISLVARPLRKRVVVNHPWFELMQNPHTLSGCLRVLAWPDWDRLSAINRVLQGPSGTSVCSQPLSG
jgi:hypothetical protein